MRVVLYFLATISCTHGASMGPIGTIAIDSIYECEENVVNDKFSFKLFFKTSPKDGNSLDAELASSIPIDNDFTYEIQVVRWANSGWQPVLTRKGNVCNDLLLYLGDLFVMAAKKATPSASPTCPIPAGTYKLEDYRASAMSFKIPVIYYGKLKATIKMSAGNEQVFCVVGEAQSQAKLF
ncbi:hypothetical protein FQR65_LT07234 [Abscondita terminalis]|nr:hypothetical protein FQR65_LT07234 [Abscondita terminalis]